MSGKTTSGLRTGTGADCYTIVMYLLSRLQCCTCMKASYFPKSDFEPPSSLLMKSSSPKQGWPFQWLAPPQRCWVLRPTSQELWIALTSAAMMAMSGTVCESRTRQDVIRITPDFLIIKICSLAGPIPSRRPPNDDSLNSHFRESDKLALVRIPAVHQKLSLLA